MKPDSQFSLNNQVALLTGASSGIGRATALALARHGAKVVAVARREQEGAETVRQIERAGGTATFVRADVSREADIIRAVDLAMQAFGRLDLAVNNAGTEGEFGKPLTDQTEALYQHVFDTNVKGVLFSMKHELAAMVKTGGGAIVNLASIAGSVGFATASVYTASKHAVLGLTRAAALEFAGRGVRINAVSPGAVQTDMADRALGGEGETDVKKHVAAQHPLGRMATPEEIASTIVFLLTPAAAFVTGADLLVDGGYTAK